MGAEREKEGSELRATLHARAKGMVPEMEAAGHCPIRTDALEPG